MKSKFLRGKGKKPILWLAAFALVGILALISARAGTPYISIEAESQSLSGTAIVGSDVAASNTQYLQFKAPTTPQPTNPGDWQNINPPISYDFNNPANNYGSQTIALSTSNPSVVYVGSNYQGVWKTIDAGTTWTRTSMTNSDGSSGCNGFDGRNWTMAVDPTNANIVYTVNGYGCLQGLWKTTDGGATWKSALPKTVSDQSTSDVYSIAIDPLNHLHILLGSHSLWSNGTAGVMESLDGGINWVLHSVGGSFGAGYYVHFLGNSNTWLLATQYDGLWRTTDSGSTWTKVSSENMSHGMSSVYRSSTTGVWYTTTSRSILRSSDGGATWAAVYTSYCSDGFGAITGDGYKLYAAPANTGGSTCGSVYYVTALEAADTIWTKLNNQTFSDGPMAMIYDSVQKIIYSSNWDAGVWKLKL
jgi:hypothetical protein